MPPDQRNVDVLFLAKNRLKMTRQSLTALLKNTNWELVHALSLWDDGSTDGTAELLAEAAELLCQGPFGIWSRRTNIGTPISIAYQHAQDSGTRYVVKIDNDAMMAPDWLNTAVHLMERAPELEVLGLEDPVLLSIDRLKPSHGPNIPRRCKCVPWVGGLYLARRSVYEDREPPVPTGDMIHCGWTDWLQRNGVRCAWIEPPLPVFLLDRLPFEPWLSLSAEYEAKGWQRPWEKYEPKKHAYLWQWANLEATGA